MTRFGESYEEKEVMPATFFHGGGIDDYGGGPGPLYRQRVREPKRGLKPILVEDEYFQKVVETVYTNIRTDFEKMEFIEFAMKYPIKKD